MTGVAYTTQIPHRSATTATTHGSDQSITDEEDSAGVHIGHRSGAVSRESSAEDYTEESEEEEEGESAEEDTWTDLSKEIGHSEPESRPLSAAHHHHHRITHRSRREELPHRPRQTARRHQPTSPESVDSSEEQYAGPAADLALRQQAGGYYAYTPQHSVQGQAYASYPHPSPAGYGHYQPPQQHVMSYGQRAQYPYSPYQQHGPPVAQYPFPQQPRMAPGYGHDVGYMPAGAGAPYNPYVSYPQMPPQIAPAQPMHYQYQQVYTPPPPVATPPVAAAPVTSPTDTDAYEDFKKMLLADKADREAREAAAKKAQEEKLAAAEDAKKRAEEIAKAAEEAATAAKTEAEKKAAAEQKKLTEKAEEAAKKAKADAEAAKKKFDEEKEAAVKAAAAAAAIPAEKQKPIKFKDAVGRKFSFPFHLCKTWDGMEDLIRQAFLHVDVIGPHVAEGHYDLIGPNSEIILPGVWETVIEPDWTITMHMWPMPEKEDALGVLDVPLLPDPPPDDKKKGKKAAKKGGGGFFLFGAPAKKTKSKGGTSAAAALAAAAIAKK